MIRRPSGDRGASVVVVLVFLLLFSVICLGLLTITQVTFETSQALRDSRGEDYAADAAIELAVQEVMADPDRYINNPSECSFSLTGANGVPATNVDCALSAPPRPPFGHGGSTGGSTTSLGAGLLTLAAPTGTAAGDLLIAQITYQAGPTAVLVPPAGWTRQAGNSSGTAVSQSVYTKVAGSGEAGPYIWAFTTDGTTPLIMRAIGAIHRYTGPGDPPLQAGPFADSGNGANINVRLANAVPKGNMIIALYSHEAATSIEAPGRSSDRMTARLTVQGPSALTLLAGDFLQFNNGTGGNWRAATGTGGRWVGHVLAVSRGPEPSLVGTDGQFVAEIGDERVRATIDFVTETNSSVRDWVVLR